AVEAHGRVAEALKRAAAHEHELRREQERRDDAAREKLRGRVLERLARERAQRRRARAGLVPRVQKEPRLAAPQHARLEGAAVLLERELVRETQAVRAAQALGRVLARVVARRERLEERALGGYAQHAASWTGGGVLLARGARD